MGMALGRYLRGARRRLVAALAAVVALTSVVSAGGNEPLPEWLLPGAFVLVPRIATGTEYNSNIFESQIRPVADQINFVTPGLFITSRWPRHAIAADIEVSYRNYLKSDLEAFDYRARLGAAFDVTRGFSVGFDVSASHQHDTFSVENVPVDVVLGNRDLSANPGGFIPVKNSPVDVVLGNRDLSANPGGFIPVKNSPVDLVFGNSDLPD